MMFVVASAPVTLFAQESSMTKIKYEPPIKYFVAGKRIRIAPEVTDPSGVKLVRCYFKGQEQADFVFVNMTADGNTYTAILPAAARNTTTIEYLFLAVNNRNQVVKTKQFSVNKDENQPAPPWQDVAMEGQLTVSTELAQAPAVLEGFSDSIAMDVVESAGRFGFVAGGIYTATQMAAVGGATGTAATATSAGTVSTAGAGGGMSAGAVIGIAAGVAVVGGGVAVAAGGISSSSSSTTCSYSGRQSSASCTWWEAVACTDGTAWYRTASGWESAHCSTSSSTYYTCIQNAASATVAHCP